MIKIDGKQIAKNILDELKTKTVPKKFLAVFLVGKDPASVSFIAQKEKIAKELGVDFRLYQYDENISNDDLREKIRQVVLSSQCGGAILQLPLPNTLNPFYAINVIPSQKDIEAMSERAVGAFYHNRSIVLPPTVAVIDEVLKSLNLKRNSFREVAVLGQGFLVGRPVTNWFLEEVPEVCSMSEGCNLDSLKNADLVVLGTGKAGLVKTSMLKKGSAVIDFGYGINEKTGKMGGDFDIESLNENGDDFLSFFTPTPGGTGPILVACLFKNFYTLNK
ncbi:MAG: bifunctional 5,10-methylenetetrahydrofolate dehydrogenase/5,10-methenyltetrahydrofolate cyclohydrolase [Candidatus Paceibacterota bacterium]|jgi:methylenetetrahydrofolate dehydrogenase (NADP+)/methenyltetrahydrofolate cyclohydrolase